MKKIIVSVVIFIIAVVSIVCLGFFNNDKMLYGTYEYVSNVAQ